MKFHGVSVCQSFSLNLLTLYFVPHKQDASSICLNGYRIAKCMKECFIYRKSYKGAINSMLLAKCLHQRLWDNSPYLLKQLPGIGMVTAKVSLSLFLFVFIWQMCCSISNSIIIYSGTANSRNWFVPKNGGSWSQKNRNSNRTQVPIRKSYKRIPAISPSEDWNRHSRGWMEKKREFKVAHNFNSFTTACFTKKTPLCRSGMSLRNLSTFTCILLLLPLLMSETSTFLMQFNKLRKAILQVVGSKEDNVILCHEKMR